MVRNPTSQAILELRDATVMRGGVRVLDRVSLTVREGEHTAIVGPNGAGKSSLIRLLTLEDYPLTTGNGVPAIRWFGRDTWVLSELRQQLGIVSAEFEAGFGAISRQGRVAGLDAVVSGFFASQGVFEHHEVTERLRDEAGRALARVDASGLAAKPLDRMSAGERRRVLIARAMVNRPRALLLDEPAAGLDLVARHQFLESIRRVAREGTTVVIVTHHVEEIFPEVGRVVLLHGGRIAADGDPRAVLTPERVSAVFGAPVDVEYSGGYFHVRVAGHSPATARP